MIRSMNRTEYYQQLIKHQPNLASSLRVRRTPYQVHEPTPKQRLALLLPHREVLYGGAAGGGKSDWLLDAALQYVDVPKYSALILRKALTDLKLSGALIRRSHEWLDGTDAKFSENGWDFPSGARLQFGYLATENDKYRYQGAEFQYIAIDEVTQIPEEDYLYMRSRLRRPRCPFHGGRQVDGKPDPLPDDPECTSCIEFAAISRVPLRMRGATNPGGLGHLWVKKRFDIRKREVGKDAEGKPVYATDERTGKPVYVGHNPKRPFVPASIADNPYLDQEEYRESLSELDPVTREQLLAGDWGVTADGRIKKRWARYYSLSPGYIVLGRNRLGPTWAFEDCFKFTITDPAASTREGPGDHQVFRTGAPSWTVVGTFLLTPDNHLIWLDNRRFKDEVDQIYKSLKANYRMHAPAFIGMELSPISVHLFQMCIRAGLPMRAFKPKSVDKLQRATPVINRMEQGRVWLPESAPWLEDLEAELFTWTAHPHEQDDQIDVLAYAGLYVAEQAADGDDNDAIEDYLDPAAIDDHTPGSV